MIDLSFDRLGSIAAYAIILCLGLLGWACWLRCRTPRRKARHRLANTWFWSRLTPTRPRPPRTPCVTAKRAAHAKPPRQRRPGGGRGRDAFDFFADGGAL